MAIISRLTFLVFFSNSGWSQQICETALLSYMHNKQVREATLDNYSRMQLRVATWNLNLLRMHFGVSADLRVRSERLSDVLGNWLLSSEAPDVLSLQEVWTEESRQIISQIAQKTGYQIVEDRDVENQRLSHGLILMVRRPMAASISAQGFEKIQNGSVLETASKVIRGVLWALLKFADGQSLLVLNTHLTPFSDYTRHRQRQLLEIRDHLQRLTLDVDHVILSGDLNIAADHSATNKRDERRLRRARWLYGEIRRELDLRDAFRSVNIDDPGYTFTPEFVPLNNFTRSKAYKRLDYIWMGERSARARVRVIDSGLRFDQPIEGILQSDHFLLYADLELLQLRSVEP